jgi:hypothetical protein
MPMRQRNGWDRRSFLSGAPDEQAGLPGALDARRANRRSLHFATPDFLSNLVASAIFMRLSLRRGTFAVLFSEAWQEIRVRSGRDDKFISPERLNCRSLGYARDDKGEGDASMKSGCWTEGAFRPGPHGPLDLHRPRAEETETNPSYQNRCELGTVSFGFKDKSSTLLRWNTPAVWHLIGS